MSIARGDAEAHTVKQKAHQDVVEWLSKNAQTYGLPGNISDLDEVQRETLQSMYEGENVSVRSYGCSLLDADKYYATVNKVARETVSDRRASVSGRRQARFRAVR